jgi:uncharacterized Zn finger protein
LARFEEVVDDRFQSLSRLTPSDKRDHEAWSVRFRPTFLKESLAGLRSVDALVEVIAYDLSLPYQFTRIAQVLAAEDRVDEALEWVARGESAFGEADPQLADLAADLHGRAGHHGQAGQIAWQRFTASPSLATYQRLQGFASVAGDWPERREAAVEVLRAEPTIATRLPGPQPSWTNPRGHSTLVEVLLWEDDSEAAWQAANFGGCTSSLWLDLARARAQEHPADAVPVLQKEILRAIEGAKRSAYNAGATLADELRGYAERAGQSDEFSAWIRRVRRENVRRRALQDEFDIARLPR